MLVFCFSRDRGNARSLENIRTAIQSILKINLSRGAFWERLATRKLQETLETFTCSLIQTISSQLLITFDLLKILNVSAILLIDSSSSSLPDGAKAQAFTQSAAWYAVVTTDDHILIYSRETGKLVQDIAITLATPGP